MKRGISEQGLIRLVQARRNAQSFVDEGLDEQMLSYDEEVQKYVSEFIGAVKSAADAAIQDAIVSLGPEFSSQLSSVVSEMSSAVSVGGAAIEPASVPALVEEFSGAVYADLSEALNQAPETDFDIGVLR